ncbi:MAG: hypothetical protein J7J76_09160 [Candidatus Latescibacteria bacterium]|nr:hypothetical protein [Candidatus Latescibacterota bacterium]
MPNRIKLLVFIFLFLFCPLAILTLFVSTQAAEIEVLESGPQGVSLRFSPPQLEVGERRVDGETYTVLYSKGCGFTSEEGRPRIPTFGFALGIPPDAEVEVTAAGSEPSRRQVGRLCPNPFLDLIQPSDEESRIVERYEVDKVFYSSSGPYPERVATIANLGYVRGNRLARLCICPFQYYPATGELLIFRKVKIRVSFSGYGAETSPLPSTDPFVPLLSRGLINYPQARLFSRKPSLPRLRKQVPIGGANRYRILVAEDGIYQITKSQLQEAGIDLNGVDPRTIRVSNRGHQVPVLVSGEEDGSFDAGDYIEFWAEYNRQGLQPLHEDMYKDPYSDYNVYWLSWGKGRGARLATESGQIVETDPRSYYSPHSYQFTVHAEQDRCFDRLGRVGQPCDHWFWSAIEGGRIRSFSVNLPDPDLEAEQRPTLTVMMWGKSYPEGGPDHHVLVYLNDVLVADQVWDGQERQKIASQNLFANQLIDGENTLTIVLPGEPDKSAGDLDAVYLNWFEVKYPRLYRARDDYIEFSPPEGGSSGVYNFVIKGFSGPQIEVYKKGISKIINARVEPVEDESGETCYQVSFQDRIDRHNTEYVALLPAAKKRPVLIEEDKPSELRNPENGADYLIIAPEIFSEVCERLADFRRSQGLQVEIVDVQDIYDEFNYGILSPEAIRDFLRFALENWQRAPSFVLLAGDGSWDYKDLYGRGNQWIPPYCAYTQKYGYTECDHLYSCLIGDDLLPDLFVGRLPVSSSQELETVIDKIIAYETSSQFGSWRRRLLFIGGLGSEFRSQSEELIANFVPPQFDASRLYVWSSSPETDPYFGGTQTLIDKIDQGLLLINFLGHGGGAIWSGAQLFNCEDVGRLHNTGRLPFVISLTCFTASFASPYGTSLGEQLLKSEGKGAVGVFGASGLGWVWHDYYLDQCLIPAFIESEGLTVGEILAEARIQFLSRYSGSIAEAMARQCTLLGDPATRLVLPSSKLELSLAGKTSLSPGDSLHLKGTTEPACSGTAEIEAFDSSGKTLIQLNLPVEEGNFSASLRLPETASPGPAQIKVYATDNREMDWIGQREFSILSPFVGDVVVSPPRPNSSDSVYVYVRIESRRGVKEAECCFPSREYCISLEPTGEAQQYVTQSALTGLWPGERVEFYFRLTDNGGEVFTSKNFVFQVSSGALLALEELLLAGEKEVELIAKIKNVGDVPSEPSEVSFWCAQEQLGRVSIPGIAPDSCHTCGIPAKLEGGSKNITVQISSLATGEPEATYAREIVVDRFPVRGKTVVGPDGRVTVTVPQGFEGTLLQISPVEQKFAVQQPDFIPICLYGHQGGAYRICPVGPSPCLEAGSNLTVSFDLPLADSLLAEERENLVIAQWDERSNLWISLGGVIDSTSICTQATRFGIFSVMLNRDRAAPTIELSVENQHYIQGGAISASPKISAILRDENGINVDKIQVLIDGTPADSSCFHLAGSDVHCLPVNLFAPLSAGAHSILFIAEDASGHRAVEQMEFNIISKSRIELLGNFPNPFSDETVFAYRIDGNPLKKFSIKIYSISGYLVRSFKDFTDDAGNPAEASGYHELTWDGSDDRGRPLANGVYFCQVKAVLENGERQEEVMKVVKMR